jgi:hypothetical protein
MQSLRIATDAVLRANPLYRVEFLDQAPPDRQDCVATAICEGGGDRTSRYLTLDEVVLLSALQTANSLFDSLRKNIVNLDRVLATLVLDELIELHNGTDFVNGIAAFNRNNGSSVAPNGAIVSRCSELGLIYALVLRHLPVKELAVRLYSFNSLPSTSLSNRPDSKVFQTLTGVDISEPAPRVGGKNWMVSRKPGWLFFRRGDVRKKPFKVYLCPRPEEAARVLPGFAAALAEFRDAVFKIAYPAQALIRPDKIVAYLSSFDDLQKFLSGLVRAMPSVSTQSVPFSAPVDDNGLFSWAVDPPGFINRHISSWRSWITREMAASASAIPQHLSEEQAAAHLKTSLVLKEIDCQSWLPRQELLSNQWRLEL